MEINIVIEEIVLFEEIEEIGFRKNKVVRFEEIGWLIRDIIN